MPLDELVALIWPEGVELVEPLGGGITNHNFKVVTGGEAYVLRVGGKDTELLGIDRAVEHEAALAAATLGLAPEVVAFADGCLVTRFVEGEVGITSAETVAPLLRRLHTSVPIAGRFDSFRIVEAYAKTAAGRVPAEYAAAKRTADRIEKRRGSHGLCPCHNDLLAGNFVLGEDRLWIVDWEYAGMGDPAFDLANFAVSNDLDEDGDRALLAAYGEADEQVHVLMRFMSDLREAMWGVVQQGIAELDFDFSAYAAEHFARLEATAAEPRFRAAVA
jgi:thiamine kinase-like enzyme